MIEQGWEDEVDWALSQAAWRRMNGTIGMMFDNSSSSNEEEWEQDSVGMDITAMLAHCHVLVVVDMVLVRGGVAVVSVVVHSRQICDDNNKSNNQE
jgi:TolB-like protein